MRLATTLTTLLAVTTSLAKLTTVQPAAGQLELQHAQSVVDSQLELVPRSLIKSGIAYNEADTQPKTSMPETAPTQPSTAPIRRPLQRRQVVTPDSGAGEAMKTARKIVGATAVGVLVFVVI